MTVDNVTQILNKIPGDKWERMMSTINGLDIPRSLVKEIKGRYSTDTEKNHAVADYYVNCHPQAEWGHLSLRLYMEDEFQLAKESKSFMSTGKSFNYTTITLLLCVQLLV